ncbi:membrane protein [Pseudomonas aeruginosa VRFPA07]|nr:membrane protein [Pseudomonas aeruginosa VRFPA07]
MRIGLDYRTVGSSPHSGISRQVYAMEQALESLPGTQVTRFTVAPLDDPLRQRAVCPPWGCPRTAMHQPHQRLRFEAGFLPRALREQDIDLYISTFNMGLPLPPRPPGVRYALLIHDLFQITLKNYHANRLKALVYRVSDYLSIAYALRVADRVWTPSQYSADEAVRLFPGVAGKVRVLPNQVDGFAGEPADLSARGLPPRYWLLVGTRELRKNVPWFVSAWARARAQAPGVPPLVLVGSLDHLPEEQRGLPGLHALGGLDDAELHALYRQAERLWQPSYAEGFGLPVVEALSVGTPVAVASGTSLDEVTPAVGAALLAQRRRRPGTPDAAPGRCAARSLGGRTHRLGRALQPRSLPATAGRTDRGTELRMSLGNLVAVVFGLAFGGALLMLSPAKAGAAMVGLAAAVTILRFPFWGLLLFALVATFMPYSTVNVGIRSTVSEAILALTWGAVLWHIFLSRLPPAPTLRYRSTERMLLWLMLFTVLPFVVGQVSIKAEASGLSNWLRWLLNLSIVFLAGRLLVERKNRETLVIALLLGTLAMLLMSIAVFIRYRSASGMAPILAMFNYANLDTLKFGLEALSSRMGSPWMHPNATGGIMALLLPLAFCYGVANQGWRRGLGLAVAVLGAAAILLASSRGAMLSLAVVLFWMSLRKVPYTGRLLLLGVGLVVVLVLSYPPLQERLATIFSPQNASTEVRFDEYRMFPKAVARYPLGIGFKVDPPVPGTDLLGISNLWLNFMYKVGLGGMLLFIAVTWRWWREARPEKGPIRLTRDNAIWLGSTGGILAALVSGLFDHYFSFAVVMIGLFWLLVGINLLEARRLFPERQPQPRAVGYRKLKRQLERGAEA